MKSLVRIAAAAAALFFSACAPSRSAQVYSIDDAQTSLEATYATVLSVQDVRIEGKTEGAGSVGGTALGASVGYALLQGPFRPAAMIAGGLVGMTVGPWVEEKLKRKRALEIELRHDDGRVAVIVQERDVKIREGQRVRITRDGSGTLRVRPVGRSASV